MPNFTEVQPATAETVANALRAIVDAEVPFAQDRERALSLIADLVAFTRPEVVEVTRRAELFRLIDVYRAAAIDDAVWGCNHPDRHATWLVAQVELFDFIHPIPHYKPAPRQAVSEMLATAANRVRQDIAS